jgi:hypothetical protein
LDAQVIIRVCIVLLALAALAGCDTDAYTTRVLEVYCEAPLNADMSCENVVRAGSVLDVTINTRTQVAQLSIVKNDGDWWVSQEIYDHCAVVDENDWTCSIDHLKSVEGGWTETVGMYKGRYFRTYTGGGPPRLLHIEHIWDRILGFQPKFS